MDDNETPWYYRNDGSVVPYDEDEVNKWEEIGIYDIRLTLEQLKALTQGKKFMGTAGSAGEYAVVVSCKEVESQPDAKPEVSRHDPLKPIKRDDLSEPGEDLPARKVGYFDPLTGGFVPLNALQGTFTAFAPPTPPAKTLQQVISDLKVRAYDHAHSAYHYEEYADSDIAEILEGIIADLERLEGAK